MGAPDVPHGTVGVRSELHHAQASAVLDHSRALPQGDARPGPARHGCPVRHFLHLEVVIAIAYRSHNSALFFRGRDLPSTGRTLCIS